MDDPFLKDIDNFEGLMSDLPPLPGGSGGAGASNREVTPVSLTGGEGDLGGVPQQQQRPASTVSFTSYGTAEPALGAGVGTRHQRQGSDTFSAGGGTVRSGRRTGQTPLGSVSGGVSLAAASSLGGFGGGAGAGASFGGASQVLPTVDLDTSTNYRSEVGSTAAGRRRGPASIAPSIGYKSTAGGSRAGTVHRAESSVGVASWLDGGEDHDDGRGSPVTGDQDDPTTGDRDLTDFEDGESFDGDDLAPELGDDNNFLSNLGVTPTVSTFSRKNRGVKRVNDVRNLKAEEATLLAEIEELEKAIGDMDAKKKSEELKYQALSRELDSKEGRKRQDIENEKNSVEGKVEEIQSYSAKRLTKIQEETAEKLGKLEEDHRMHENRRYGKIIDELQTDVDDLANQNDGLEMKRELLKLNGMFTPEGIYVATTDAGSLKEKLALAVPLVNQFIVQKQDFLRDHVVEFIQQETNKVVVDLWDHRRRQSAEEATQRRKVFVEFTEESRDRFLRFTEKRTEQRVKDVRRFHEQVRKNSEDLRTSSLARTLEIQEKVNSDLKLAAEEFEKKMEQALAYHKEKTSTINSNDHHICVSQVEELDHRLKIDRNVLRKLLENQRDSTEISLRKAMELSTNATKWREVRALFSAGKQRCSHMTTNTMSQAGEMARVVGARVRQQQARNAYLLEEGESTGGGEPRVHKSLSDFISRLEQHGSTETSQYREEAELRFRIADHEETVSALRRKTFSELGQLTHDREKCQLSRERLEKQLDDLLTEVQSAQLFHQSEISKLDVVRTHWEKDHMAQLHSSAAVTPTKKDTHDGSIEARTGFHPFLEGLVTVSEHIREKIVDFTKKASDQKKTRIGMLGTQKREDEVRVEQQEKTAATWEGLFSEMMKLSSWVSDISERQVRVDGEYQKLSIERELLEYENARMAKDAERLRSQATEIEEESNDVFKKRVEVKSKVHAMEDKQKLLSSEQARLINLQSHLRARQEEIFEERRKINEAKSRIDAKKSALASAGYTAKRNWSKLFNVEDHFFSFGQHLQGGRQEADEMNKNLSPNTLNSRPRETKRETLDELLAQSSPGNVRRRIVGAEGDFSTLTSSSSLYEPPTNTTYSSGSRPPLYSQSSSEFTPLHAV